MTLRSDAHAILDKLGVDPARYTNGALSVRSPLTGEDIAEVVEVSPDQASDRIEEAHQAFKAWRKTPAPRRGELVRLLAEELRKVKDDLGRLVTIEAGKIPSEGLGEVQEMIDICDFAVGLSRQLYGLTITTERPGHRMMETWHPIGVVGIISAFNFPVAVWSWNAALALVCGDSVVWKPSEKTPLTALACQAIFERAAEKFGDEAPKNLSTLLVAGLGLYNVTRLNVDAVPDITNVQVQINSEAPGYSPLESEQRITYPVENAMAGNAFRPGDVLTARNGETVEINNTDAEGRLVLADALALGQEEAPDLMISMATLTGAARVAVGPDLAPFYTDHTQDAAALTEAAQRHADPVWQMLFHTPYEAMIEPQIADLDNAPSGGFAGSITAALFLRRFAGDARYMHFDIYGWCPSAKPGLAKGGVSQGVRALFASLPGILSL